jgi:pyruvate,water dikinase
MKTSPSSAGTLISLDHSDALDPSRCGHKAATLARLRQAGHRVPDGAVLAVEHTRGVAQANAALVASLNGMLSCLGGRVAVRSSGVAEDLPDASWAGQYESVLNVDSPQALHDALTTCIASGQSARARQYGHSAGVAVLIQRMVDAEVAGVAFSANPISGDRHEVVINAVAGLGDKLMSGEVSGDEWIVRGPDEVRAVVEHGVLSSEQAAHIAATARTLEAELGAPQDVEWAILDGELTILQARPITALPLAPELEVLPPNQVWEKDAAHFSDPISPYGASVYVPSFKGVLERLTATWGMMIEDVETRVIGHEVYLHVMPFGGGSESASPPPWWVLAVASRLVPPIRKRLAAGKRALDAGLRESVVEDWHQRLRPALLRELSLLRALEIEGLSEVELLEHLDGLLELSARGQSIHFDLFLPYAFSLYELSCACRELLGWDEPQMLKLLQGLSDASSAPTRALGELSQYLRDRPKALATIRDDAAWPTTLEREDPEAASAIAAYRDAWGLRTLNYDPGSPTLADEPALFAGLVRDSVAIDHSPADLEGERQAEVERARAGLSGPKLDRFNRVLAVAERTYPLREDNMVFTDSMPCGLLRRAGVELGRRLVEAGRLSAATDAMMLSLQELLGALQRTDGERDLRALVARRRAELAFVRANPGPLRYGPKPGLPPDVRGLPASARMINGAMIWFMGIEIKPAEPSEGALRGLGACAGTYRGRVRVIRRVEDLHRLRRGEVLVCPITNPAWSIVFSQAGALITDAGSVLSHSAIVAREHGLPAIVAAGDATRQLRDGMEVTVDGTHGTIMVH